jgi:hypothetical protein
MASDLDPALHPFRQIKQEIQTELGRIGTRTTRELTPELAALQDRLQQLILADPEGLAKFAADQQAASGSGDHYLEV